MTASSVFLHQSQSCDTVPLQYINYFATLLCLFRLQEGRLGLFLDERQGGIGVSIPHLHVVSSLQIHPKDQKFLIDTLYLTNNNKKPLLIRTFGESGRNPFPLLSLGLMKNKNL